MKAQIVDGVTLEICPNCAGTWFGADELKTMLGTSQAALSDVERALPHVEQRLGGQSQMLCPDDKVRLDQYHYLYSSPAVIHTCSICGGFFVAATELPKMEQAHAEAHMPANDAAEDLAILTAEHGNFMARQRAFQGLFRTLSTRSPGWFA